jgi:hypothetical protein
MTIIHVIIRNTGAMLLRPQRAGETFARSDDLRPAAWLVTGFGSLYGLGFYLSYLAGDYPPPPDVMGVWVAAWGEFAMLPFLAIPAEKYRLFLTYASLPLALAAWMLMGGSAFLISRLTGGKVCYTSYLSLCAFGFFPMWILSTLFDAGYNALLGEHIVPALTGQYGQLAKSFYRNFPVFEYTLMFGLAGVLIGTASYSAERTAGAHPAVWKAALTGWTAFAWPTLLVAVLVR